ncbi:DUF6394 family protein [Propioniciclava tarda]|uniref:Uncharacterized protein n=1 Tax=Propioniciclava tarda TaxID=433330 RepID=A0A4Q9KK60_PROTD|nr:DUF6394 family protein [Propioniciclava tarda]TBT94555.1 hypothetical protein ET996_10195 [Propioniciclava tarda]SMO68566.1 hypothetical protein SAMN06266982_11225 [Propioniciclava tarda]HOA87866.1 DUF6394 family protein [Propioniciclava tarda]HQA30008.1 DUF6394 family protein [Propioniciclava tarda]HQD59644.1 DUF6394 family protein [Propioniciclava tarda]
MNFEKVVFGFFVLLAATLNFGYVTGEIGNPAHHNELELYAAIVVNIVVVVLKLGDRTQMGAMHLASSLVASIQLLVAGVQWVWETQAKGIASMDVSPHAMSSVVSLALGALLANIVSVVLMVIETANFRRRV